MGRTHDVTISAFGLDYLEKELSAERALADRLALALGDFLNSHLVDTALEAGKEARK